MASIRTLRIFLAVARHGTFVAAGNEVGLTPAAVGLQIRALEADLNCPLLDRSARAAVLNPQGRRLLPAIEDVVRRYESLAVGDDADGLTGTVVMGALVSALMGSFANALWDIKRQHTRLDVRLFAGLSSDFTRQVDAGELDAAIVTLSPRPLPANLMWTPLYSEPMVLITPKRPHFELSGTPADILQSAPFIRFDRSAWTGILVETVIAQMGVPVNESMELNSVEAIIELVRHGFGVSIVPKLANVAWSRDRSLNIVPFEGLDIRRRVGLIERRQHARMRFTAVVKSYFSHGELESA
jgi:DNA-binding transcriptional LysR family regulator